MSDAKVKAEKLLTGEDQWVVLRLPDTIFNISISGVWAGNITIQRSFNGSDWFDVEVYTTNVERVGEDPEENIDYRVGFKTGEYVSGSALVRISQ